MKGRVAQLVEHYLDMVVVAGSSPVVATIITPILILIFLRGFDFYQMILKGIKRAPNNAFIALQNYNTNSF